ncbi:MAG: nicotinate-nucleotide adenylyltransferase [Thermoleophilaceae bacterium]
MGILGGAFNPPHIGHLVCAQEALVQLELERVVFVPVGEAPHRDIEQDPGPDARSRMCELAIEGDERFELSRAELDRPGPSYTADTLRELRERLPGDELVLILGGDQAANLPSWHEPEEVFAMAVVAVVERMGSWHREAVAVKLASLAGAERVRFFDMPRMGISSTVVRRRAAQGKPLRYLVPESVRAYIEENGLYRASAPVGAD